MKLYDKLPIKKAYYRIFTGMIMFPLLQVLVLSLELMGKLYLDQAIENIRGVQQGVAGEVQSDVEFMSMRLWTQQIPMPAMRPRRSWIRRDSWSLSRFKMWCPSVSI